MLALKDFPDNQDSSRKQVSSGKQVSSRKQDSSSNQDDSNKEDSSNKQDKSINYITDVDPDILCDKLRETLSRSVMLESDYTMTQKILDELLRVRCITRKQCNAMCEKKRINIKIEIIYLHNKNVLCTKQNLLWCLS